ncbi:MAG: hypothetical protein ACK41E_11730, partial [Deinococcales bacterium]
MNIYKTMLLIVLVLGLVACKPEGITGGTVTAPNSSATLSLPTGTFPSPVPISINPINAPILNSLDYVSLIGGAFEVTAPTEFTASQNAIFEILETALNANGKPLTAQNVPTDSIVVALAKRPNDLQPTM